MKAALIVFDDMTALDFIGFYDPITRLRSMKIMPDLEWNICARRAEVTDDRGLRMRADRIDGGLEEFDMVFVPGGMGTRRLQHDDEFIRWLRTAAGAKLKISVCTGSLLLGAAGYLHGLTATTHPSALKELEPYCAKVVRERIVDHGSIVTGAGVSTSVDLGLHVISRFAGIEARDRVAQQMDYPYRWTAQRIA